MPICEYCNKNYKYSHKRCIARDEIEYRQQQEQLKKWRQEREEEEEKERLEREEILQKREIAFETLSPEVGWLIRDLIQTVNILEVRIDKQSEKIKELDKEISYLDEGSY